MRRKVKKTLTFLTTLVMVVSLVCGSGFSAFAENMDVSGEVLSETGEQEMASVDEGSGSVGSGTYEAEAQVTAEETLPSENISGSSEEQGTTGMPTQEPVTTAPAVIEPATTVPEETEPVTTAPETTEPVTAEPEVTEPATSTPEAAESVISGNGENGNGAEGTGTENMEPVMNAPEETEISTDVAEGTEAVTDTPEPETESNKEPESETNIPEATESETDESQGSELDVPEETEAETESEKESETEEVSESELESETETESENESESESESETEEEGEIIYIPVEQPAGINVRAYVKAGALPEGTKMYVRTLSGDAEIQAEAALENEAVKYDGFLAVDISFVGLDGLELEPAEGTVRVEFGVNTSLLPEDADTATLAVQHHVEENGSIEVETVAEAAAGTIEVQDGTVKADFEVESFSTFTITWQGNTRTGLTATCIDTTGSEVTPQYINAQTNATILGNTVTYYGNRENIIEATAVEALAPTVQNAAYAKTVVASSANAANTGGIKITHVRREGNTWQYSTDEEETWSDIGNNKVYFIYDRDHISDSKDSITFVYYGQSEINDLYSIADRNAVKFTIVLVDENGENETYELPEGSTVPDSFTFNSSIVGMNAASFAQMGITIPGYTWEGGYAYFYWTGNFQGGKFNVQTFRNMGANSTTYGNYYDSYIGYSGIYPGNTSATTGVVDYSKETFGDTGDGYYAYNPTGTLRIVFVKVSERTAYKSNFVDAYQKSTYEQIDVKDMEMHQIDSSTDYYGTLKEVTTTKPTREGYTFAGWYMDKDEDGNGTGQQVVSADNDTTHYQQDAYYYAKWIPRNVEVTVTKTLSSNMGDQYVNKNAVFEFYLTLTNETGGAYTGEIKAGDQTLTAEEGKYRFNLQGGNSLVLDIPYGYGCSVEEKDYSGEGYSTKVQLAGGSAMEQRVITISSVTKDSEIIFDNYRAVSAPTGLTESMMPYLLMIFAAFAAILLFPGYFRRSMKR